MKEKLLKMLRAKQEQRDRLNAAMIDTDSKEERAEIGKTLKALAEEISEIEDMIKDADEPSEKPKEEPTGNEPPTNEPEGEGKRSFSPVAAMQMRNAKPTNQDTDPFDTPEYRSAFMAFCTHGTPIPAELRDNAKTTTSDAGAAIPTTYVNEIIKKVESYGNLYKGVRKLNVQGGVKIPILSLKPTATWVGEGASDSQKITANDSVTFNYYGLECKLSQSLLVNVTTISAFQNLFVELASEAMIKALDLAIMSGAGTSSPLGITVDTRVPTANKITLSPAEFTSWSDWKKKVFGKMKKSYRNGTFYMAQSTFDGYIDGMVDTNGQPIGRVNYGIDGGENYRFGGKTVDTVEDDIIKSYDDASTGDIVAVFVDLKNYAINSNLEMQTVKWVDHDTNEVKNKVIMICDGKLIDPNGVLIVKKGAAPTPPSGGGNS